MPSADKMMFDEIATGTRLEVSASGKWDSEPLVSQLLAPLAGPLALVAVPIAERKLVEWPDGTQLTFRYVQKGQGLWTFKATILSKTSSNRVEGFLVQLSGPPERFQRREYYRLDCTLDLVFRPAAEESGDGGTAAAEKKTPAFPGVTLNISGGGASFVTPPGPERMDEIEIALTLEGFGPVVARGRVLRRDDFDTPQSRRQRYAVQFSGISPQDRDALVRYVFNRQRRHLKES
ncbi:MAG: PilZ domain-containing protein [Clostridia bacterium]|nr:PilZ domain-containing protein [Clostridia bacterium]